MTHKITFEGKDYLGKEIEFESLSEQWNRYKLKDGTVIRAKLNVFKILRALDEKGEQAYSGKSGEPVYLINHRIDVVISNLD